MTDSLKTITAQAASEAGAQSAVPGADASAGQTAQSISKSPSAAAGTAVPVDGLGKGGASGLRGPGAPIPSLKLDTDAPAAQGAGKKIEQTMDLAETLMGPVADKLAEAFLQTAPANLVAVAAFKKIALKPSWKTGEFWLIAAVLVAANALAADGVLSGTAIAMIDFVTPLGFQYLRQSFKDPQHQRIVELLQSESLPKGEAK